MYEILYLLEEIIDSLLSFPRTWNIEDIVIDRK